MKRAFFDLILIFVLFLLPWWVTLFLIIVGLFIFKKYFEFIVFAIAVVNLSTVTIKYSLNKGFYLYASIIIIYLLIQFLKSRIILYKNEIPFKT